KTGYEITTTSQAGTDDPTPEKRIFVHYPMESLLGIGEERVILIAGRSSVGVFTSCGTRLACSTFPRGWFRSWHKNRTSLNGTFSRLNCGHSAISSDRPGATWTAP